MNSSLVTRARSDQSRWLGFFSLYGTRLLGLGAALVLSIGSARFLTPPGRGDYVSVAAGVAIGAQILNLGQSASLLVLFARYPPMIRKMLPYLWLIAILWASLLGSSGLSLSVILERGLPYWWLILVAWIPIQVLNLHQSSALMALREYGSIAALELLGRFTALCLAAVALLVLHGKLIPFLVALIVADLVVTMGGAGLVCRSTRSVGELSTDALSIRQFLVSASKMGLRAQPLLLLPYLLIKSDLLILRGFRGAAETGIYSIASQIIDVGLILPATLASLVLPDLVTGVMTPATLRKLMSTMAIILFAGSAVLGAAAPTLIPLLFGVAYRNAYLPLWILLPGFAALSLEVMLSQYFAARDFPVFLIGYWILALSINVMLNILLIPRYGMVAAAANSTLSYILVFSLVFLRFRKETAVFCKWAGKASIYTGLSE